MDYAKKRTAERTVTLETAIEIARQVHKTRYPAAPVVLLAGSIVRGEATAFSDLDLIVLFDTLPHACVESFYHDGFPVEAFVHDSETLNHFMTVGDRRSGVCVMSQMVLEGIELPAATDLSQKMKSIAATNIKEGPSALSQNDLSGMRYGITNLIDDIRQPRSRDEVIATGALLYSELANCYLRANGLWAAKGKSIPRKLDAADPELAVRFCRSFERLFADGHPQDVIALAEHLLKPVGGFLFEGARRDASPDERKTLS